MPARVLQFSDIHFGCEDTLALRAATDFAQSTPFDLLVLSGDITQFGHENEFQAAASWLKTAPGPILSTPGNHDTPWAGLWERFTDPFALYARMIGPPAEASFERGALKVEALNSARGWQLRLNWSKGEISRRQASSASQRLASGEPRAARLLVCHHPLVEVVGGPMTGRVRGGRSAAECFAQAGVDLILTGHLHAPFFQALPFGDGRTYALGASTLSRRERGAPPGFNVIEIDGDQLTVKAMAWNGRSLEVWRTWAAELRPRGDGSAVAGAQSPQEIGADR